MYFKIVNVDIFTFSLTLVFLFTVLSASRPSFARFYPRPSPLFKQLTASIHSLCPVVSRLSPANLKSRFTWPTARNRPPRTLPALHCRHTRPQHPLRRHQQPPRLPHPAHPPRRSTRRSQEVFLTVPLPARPHQEIWKRRHHRSHHAASAPSASTRARPSQQATRTRAEQVSRQAATMVHKRRAATTLPMQHISHTRVRYHLTSVRVRRASRPVPLVARLWPITSQRHLCSAWQAVTSIGNGSCHCA